MLQWWIDNPHQKIWAKERFSGENSNFWEGGKSKISSLLRSSSEYKEWRIKVFHRDCFRCVWCGDKHKIEADHIKPFAYFPELRFNVDNGRTLCKECHKKTDTYLVKARKYKQNA